MALEDRLMGSRVKRFAHALDGLHAEFAGEPVSCLR